MYHRRCSNICRPKKNIKIVFYFYRLGDFYEMFFDDALTVSKELELTLTGKSCGTEERAPMCGIPVSRSGRLFKPAGCQWTQSGDL